VGDEAGAVGAQTSRRPPGHGSLGTAALGAGYQTRAGVHGETRSVRELGGVRFTWQPSGWTHEWTH
jgi:hypothetical protein